jgi:hypothetical protein
VETDNFQGNLIAEQPEIIKENLPWARDSAGDTKGYGDDDADGPAGAAQWSNRARTAVLHCEFEGGGIYKLMEFARALLAVAAVTAALCWIPIIGWILCLIVPYVALAISLAGLASALNDTGNPNDVATNLGELHVNDPTGRGADIVVVKGAWVYDSQHRGWNEIHPIKYCQRIGTYEGNWAGYDVRVLRDHWCDAINRSDTPAMIANQARPENQWTVHPALDGCLPANEPPVIK